MCLKHELARCRAFATIPGQPGSSQNLLKLGGCSGIPKIIQVIHLKSVHYTGGVTCDALVQWKLCLKFWTYPGTQKIF